MEYPVAYNAAFWAIWQLIGLLNADMVWRVMAHFENDISSAGLISLKSCGDGGFRRGVDGVQNIYRTGDESGRI